MTVVARATRATTLALGAMGLVACEHYTPPPTREITIELCDGSTWAAYLLADRDWMYLGPGNGSYTFAATERIGIARGNFPEGSSYLTVDWLTADQAVEKFRCTTMSAGPGLIGGDVTGANGPQWAAVYYSGAVTSVASDQSSWQLNAQVVPATLVATLFEINAPPYISSRVIVRHDQSYLPGVPVPLLDFDSDEAFVPDVHTVAVTGPLSYAIVSYITRGRTHFLSNAQIGPAMPDELPRNGAIHTIPATRMATGDLHLITIDANDRTTQQYVREGRDLSLALGPPLAALTFITHGTVPYRRDGVTLQVQPEYAAAFSVEMTQATPGHLRTITLNATREAVEGQHAFWALTVPDFSHVTDFPESSAFEEGEFSWVVRATSRRFGLSPSTAQEGETARNATRHGAHP